MNTIPVKVHNRFDFELTDAKTGAVKQKCTCYNIVLNQYFTRLVGNSSTINGIMLGTGTGTPVVTRTSLFNFLIRKEATVVGSHIAYPTSYVRKKITLSPSECVGANITEVGFCGIQSSSGYLTTHSMLKDSEGNQIAIQKTDTDVLTVYATFFVTIEQPSDSSYILPDANHSYIIYRVLGVGEGSYYSTAYFCSDQAQSNAYNIQYSQIASSSVSMSSDTTNLRIHFTASRLNYDSAYNDHMFSVVGIPTIAAWKLPNADIFPLIPLRNVPIGNGNGVKTEYDLPVPLFAEGSEVIRVDGVVMQRGVDYTIKHDNNNLRYGELFPCANRANVSTVAGHAVSSTNASRPVMVAARTQTEAGLCFPTGGNNKTSPTAYTEFDFGSAKPFNRIRFSSACIKASYSYSSLSVNLVLQYSVDGVTWTTAFDQTVGPDSDEIIVELAPVVNARYWRGFTTGSYHGYATKWPNISIYYYEPGLVFTNPPADGAAIEMDCQLDRPIKNENWVLDFSCSIQFARG